MSKEDHPLDPRRQRLHEVIFEADTRAGRLFDTVLIVTILSSVLVGNCSPT